MTGTLNAYAAIVMRVLLDDLTHHRARLADEVAAMDAVAMASIPWEVAHAMRDRHEGAIEALHRAVAAARGAFGVADEEALRALVADTLLKAGIP